MGNVCSNLEAQIRQALDSGEVSDELEQCLTLSSSDELSDRHRKLLQLLEDAIANGHVHRFLPSPSWAS